jgi:HD-like signal output (HDOD) protein
MMAAPPAGVCKARLERSSRVIAALRAGWSRPGALVWEVNRLLAHSPVDLGRVDAAVESDPAMASALWAGCARLCGTAAWDGDSVDEAMVLLGLDRFRFLISTYAWQTAAAQRIPPRALTAYWRKIFCSACVCDRIGRWLGHLPAEQPFLAGLLCDVGMLPLLAALRGTGDGDERIYRRMGQIRWEQKVFGLDHCLTGGVLAREWQLPAPYACVVTHHHDAAETKSASTLLRIVAAAEEIVAGNTAESLCLSQASPEKSRRPLAESLLAGFPRLGASGARNLAAAIQDEWSQFAWPSPERTNSAVE